MSENSVLKLLCNVSCMSLSDQSSNFLRFTVANFSLMSTAKLLQSYYIKKPPLTAATQGLSKILRLKFLRDIIFPFLRDQSHSPCFTK